MDATIAVIVVEFEGVELRVDHELLRSGREDRAGTDLGAPVVPLVAPHGLRLAADGVGIVTPETEPLLGATPDDRTGLVDPERPLVVEVLTLALSMINARFPRMRGITHGVPVVIVQDGEPDLQNLKRERLSLDDLMAAARQQGIRRFADIDLAVLETNGRISFFARTSAQDGAPEEPDPA